MGASSGGLAGDNAAILTQICVFVKTSRLTSAKQLFPPTRKSCGLDQERGKSRPPEAIVRQDGEAEDERQRVRAQCPQEPEWAEDLSKKRDHDQVPMADRITRDPPVPWCGHENHHSQGLPDCELMRQRHPEDPKEQARPLDRDRSPSQGVAGPRVKPRAAPVERHPLRCFGSSDIYPFPPHRPRPPHPHHPPTPTCHH